MTTINIENLDYLKKLLPLFGEKLTSLKTSEIAGVLMLSDSSDDPMNSIEIYPALKENEVKDIELKLGFTLHPDFRNLLLHLNGGYFFQDLNIWGLKKVYSEDEFLDQNCDLVHDQIEGKEGWEHRVWKNSDLIVGSDGLGNLVVLNNENGKVTYLDNEFPDNTIEGKYNSILNYIDEYLVVYTSEVIGLD